MNQLFFDATYFGKLHWREPGSAEVLTCAATADEIVCSLHGRAEFYSIGFRKVREGLATPSTVQAVFAELIPPPMLTAAAAARGKIAGDAGPVRPGRLRRGG